METEGLDFARALESLAERAGIELERDAEDPRDAERRQQQRRGSSPCSSARRPSTRGCCGSRRRRSRRAPTSPGRGLEEAVLREFRVGWSPRAWDRVHAGSRRAGYTDAELLAAGLVDAAARRVRAPGPLPRADHVPAGRRARPRARLRGTGAGRGRAAEVPQHLGGRALPQGADGLRRRPRAGGRGARGPGRARRGLHGRHRPAPGRHPGDRLLHGHRADGAAGGRAEAPRAPGAAVPGPGRRRAGGRGQGDGRDPRLQRRIAPGTGWRCGSCASRPAAIPPTSSGRPAPRRCTRCSTPRCPVARFALDRALEANDLETPEGRDRALQVVAPIIGRVGPGLLQDDLIRLAADRLQMTEAVTHEALRRAGRGRGAGRNGAARPRGPAARWSPRSTCGRTRSAPSSPAASRSRRRAAPRSRRWTSTRPSATTSRGARRTTSSSTSSTRARTCPPGADDLARLIAELVIRAGELAADPAALAAGAPPAGQGAARPPHRRTRAVPASRSRRWPSSASGSRTRSATGSCERCLDAEAVTYAFGPRAGSTASNAALTSSASTPSVLAIAAYSASCRDRVILLARRGELVERGLDLRLVEVQPGGQRRRELRWSGFAGRASRLPASGRLASRICCTLASLTPSASASSAAGPAPAGGRSSPSRRAGRFASTAALSCVAETPSLAAMRSSASRSDRRCGGRPARAVAGAAVLRRRRPPGRRRCRRRRGRRRRRRGRLTCVDGHA